MNWKEFEVALLDYNRIEVHKILQQYLSEHNALDFIDYVIVNSLKSIGDKWERGEVALSQIYMSCRLCEEIAVSILADKRLPSGDAPPIAIVTLEDYHTLGKKIVCSVVRSSGYPIKDYGTLEDPEDILRRVTEDKIKILMISVLMYPSALKIKNITQLLHEKDPSIKIMVGGAPFLMSSNLWKEVGADELAKNATDSITILNRWLKEEHNE